MSLERGEFLYGGKGKNLYEVKRSSDLVWVEFKDDLTAFNGSKKSFFKGKGAINRDVSSLIFRFLEQKKIATHWREDKGKQAMICRKIRVFPLEVVVRNRLTGSTAKKFQFPDGKNLSHPLVEFYYKSDRLQDPFISLDQAFVFGFISDIKEGEFLKAQALKINSYLKTFFDVVGLELIDFKLEFGQGGFNSIEKQIVLGDEISCDSCRLWDKNTGERRDKDRFRLNLGFVEENYQKVKDLLFQRWSVLNHVSSSC